jgi:hypothetical protein
LDAAATMLAVAAISRFRVFQLYSSRKIACCHWQRRIFCFRAAETAYAKSESRSHQSSGAKNRNQFRVFGIAAAHDGEQQKAFRLPGARNFCLTQMKDIMSIQLSADRFDLDKEVEPLGELLEHAVRITFPSRPPLEGRALMQEAKWISRWAIRAVCDEIVRTGNIKLPLTVRFTQDVERWPKPKSKKTIPFDPAA